MLKVKKSLSSTISVCSFEVASIFRMKSFSGKNSLLVTTSEYSSSRSSLNTMQDSLPLPLCQYSFSRSFVVNVASVLAKPHSR